MYPEDTPKEEIIKNSHYTFHVICGTCQFYSIEGFCKKSHQNTDKYWYCPLYERK